MENNHQHLDNEHSEAKRRKLDFEAQASTSSAALHRPNREASVPRKDPRCRWASHCWSFFHSVAMLLLYKLRERDRQDWGFEHHVWINREEYGKFGDIVLRYQKPGGKVIKICVQCLNLVVRIKPDGSRIEKNINAEDFLSGRNKSFSLVEYIKSFVESKAANLGCETYYMLLTNSPYNEDMDCNYPFFQCKNIDASINEESLLFLDRHGFQIKYNNTLCDHLVKLGNLVEGDGLNLNEKVISEFCNKFLFLCVDRDLKHNLGIHCIVREDPEVNNRKRTLHYLVSQHTMDLNKDDLIFELDTKGISFNVPPARLPFTGRETELHQIREALECKEKENVFDLIVTGMAGMGKTQTVCKFLEEDDSKYKNFIWLNAENKVSLENSFVELSNCCKLIEIDCKVDISVVIKLMYSYFKNHTLFIFENASNEILSRNEKNEYIYLPNYDRTRSSSQFLVISDDEIWAAKYPHVTIGPFSEQEAILYLDKAIVCSKEERLQLAETFEYWPLALCLAVNYINLVAQSTLNTRSDIIASMETKNLLNLPANHHTESLQSVWLLIQKYFQSKDHLAFKIIQILSFSDHDNFPTELLQFDSSMQFEIDRAIATLHNASLVIVNHHTITLQHSLQSVITNSIISNTELYESTLLNGAQCFKNYLEPSVNRDVATVGNNQMVTFLHHLCESKLDPLKYIKMANHLLEKLILSEDLRQHCGIFHTLLEVTQQKLGENNLETCATMYRTALMLRETGNYDASLTLFSRLENVYIEKLGRNDNVTAKCIYEKGVLLKQMGKYKDVLCILNELIENNVSGVQHMGLLLYDKASVLKRMEKYEESFGCYKLAINALKKRGGATIEHLALTMQKAALVLQKLRSFESALKACNYAIEIETKEMGRTQSPLLDKSLSGKASILCDMARFEEALRIYNHWIKSKTAILGEHHPEILSILHNKADVLYKMKKYGEALSIYSHVAKGRRRLLGYNHPDTVKSVEATCKIMCEWQI